MSDFNPNQDQQFCGASDLKFFTDMAPRRVMLEPFAQGVVDQASEAACTGLATDVVLDIFCNFRGLQINLSWSFIYWIARQIEQGTSFAGEDTGLQEVASVFRALYLLGASTQALAPDLSAGTRPSPEAFADAATRKVTLFERIDLFDCKNAIVTALAHGIPIAAEFAITWPFSNLRTADPVEQMAAYNFPTGRLWPGYPDFQAYHFLPLVGYDLDLNCVFVQNSNGPQWCAGGVGAISFDTAVVQILKAYCVREFAGLTSYVDPKWIVAANANHDSAFMLKLRRYMFNVLTNDELTQLYKSQVTREAMPMFGVTAQDLADAAAPWGVTLKTVEDFLSLSAPQ